MAPASMKSFPWVSSRTLHFTAQGKYELSFPPECPLSINFYEFRVDHRLTPSYHDHLEIAYVYEGKGRFVVENKVYTLDPGDVVVVGTREFHRMEVDHMQYAKLICMHFMPELVYTPGASPLDFEYLRPFYYGKASFVNKVPASALAGIPILDLLTEIYREIQGLAKDYPLAVKTYLNQILLALARHYQGSVSGDNTRDERLADVERLREVLGFLRGNYHEKLTLGQVAKVACMSPSYFCRFFKRVTGNSLINYVLRLRIDRSKELLLSTDESVTEIAYEVGFDSQSYFDRVFRRFTGVSPLELRQKAERH